MFLHHNWICLMTSSCYHLLRGTLRLLWPRLYYHGTCHPTPWSIIQYQPCKPFKIWPGTQGTRPGQLYQRCLFKIQQKQCLWSPRYSVYPFQPTKHNLSPQIRPGPIHQTDCANGVPQAKGIDFDQSSFPFLASPTLHLNFPSLPLTTSPLTFRTSLTPYRIFLRPPMSMILLTDHPITYPCSSYYSLSST